MTPSVPGSDRDAVAHEPVTKPLAPLWIFKITNPLVSTLLRSPLHGVLSHMLMLISYRGRKSGRLFTHPIGYFTWEDGEVMAFTSARWWVNLQDGRPVTLRLKGQLVDALPTVIHERGAVIETLEQFVQRLSLKAARMLPVGLPRDREPTRADYEAAPPGMAFVHFKLIPR